MKKYNWLILIVSITTLSHFASASAGEQNESFDLNELYRIAVSKSEQIKIAREEMTIAEKDRSRALSVLIPRFTAFGNYSTENYDIDLTTSPAASTPSGFDQTTDTTSWGIRFDQSFTLNGRELAALSMSKDMIEKSRLDLINTKEEYLYQVATVYYGVLQATKAVDIAVANVKRLEKHRNAVAARLALEDVTRTDMYRAESELSGARSDYIDAENRLKYARASLRSLVDLPADFTLSEPVDSSPGKPEAGLEELQKTGLTKRSIILSDEFGYKAASKNVRIEKGDHWPTLALEAQYVDSNEDVENYTPGTDTDTAAKGYKLGATLTFTLFDGGLNRAEVKQALAKKRQAALRLEIRKKEVKLEIENTFLDVQSQTGKLSALKDKLKYSKQNYTAVSELFRHGLSNSVDMMDANTVLVSAERELSNAEYDLKLAVLKLKKVTGTYLDNTGLNL